MARSAGRDRTVCESCELPFYADKGECPYCRDEGDANGGATDEESGFVFGETAQRDRDRTRCPDCGLPHYADADGCPYCAYAGGSDADQASESPGTDEPVRTERTDADVGLFGRIKRALGF